jgi:hypothetical protein
MTDMANPNNQVLSIEIAQSILDDPQATDEQKQIARMVLVSSKLPQKARAMAARA